MENNGSAATDDGWPKPGDHLTLRAKMVVFVVISDCLDALNPATAGSWRRTRAISDRDVLLSRAMQAFVSRRQRITRKRHQVPAG